MFLYSRLVYYSVSFFSGLFYFFVCAFIIYLFYLNICLHFWISHLTFIANLMNILSSGKNLLRMLKKEYIKLTSLSFLTGHCPLDKHHQTEISRKFGVSISFDGPLSTFEAAIFRTRLERGAAAILFSKLPQIGTRSWVRTVCKDCVCVVNNLMSRQHCKQVFKKKKDGVYVINQSSA